MGQNQPKENGDTKRQEGTNQTMPAVDRVGAKFQGRESVNPASGTGAKGNPGKPI